MSNNENVSVMTHLDELRKRLTVIAAVNIGAAMLLFNKASIIIDYFLAINPGMQLVYITPSELLGVYIQLAFIMAFVLCSPVTGYQIWAFVEKGLYDNEKKYIVISLIFGVICFLAGVAFCYFMVLPTTLGFFVRIAIEEVESMISVKSYISFINAMLLSFGAVFEMPVVVFLLTKLEILRPEFLKKNKGIMIVIIFIAAAIITPPDIVSQIMLGIPMVILLEISTKICEIVYKTNKKTGVQV
ncbi:MAG: twin-arginine translocase subunit TatC [Oscillospiraceae bacterium]|nr:twin-arginine translocase subunit TatC [Oscillospiraceae bacterium]